jgi:hypothetical protein
MDRPFIVLVLGLLPLLTNGQQTYREQSTIDLLGNRNPVFNYMPNPGHVDLDALDFMRKNTDLREEDGWWHLFPVSSFWSGRCLLGVLNMAYNF